MRRIFRVLAGTILGTLLGGVFGIALTCLLAPARVPGQPTAHEWYGMALLVYTFFSALGGAIVGAVVAAVPCRETYWLAGTGLVLGLAVGQIVWANDLLEPRPLPLGPSWRSYRGFTIIAFTFATAIVSGIVGIVWVTTREWAQRQASDRGSRAENQGRDVRDEV